ncbi:MAG: hypothetical protein E7082_01010 [Bacteroidales bacterium]|nr:hypothetical protein [Bacteroidales bacterium]
MIHRFLTLVAFLLGNALMLCAQKPAWLNNTPQEKNRTYKFVEVTSYGSNLEGARIESQKKLAKNEQLIREVTVSVEREGVQNIEQTFTNNHLDEIVNNVVDIKTNIRGQEFTLQAVIVDEYASTERGLCKLHTLFMVAVEPNPVFDNVYLTTKYGFSARALVPGWAQMHKGSTGKGIAIIAAEVAAIGGIIYTENERATYKSKMRSQPNFAKKYKAKADNFETARNCCIGAAAAIYLYNLIDAIVAPGAKRVVVKPRNLDFAFVANEDFSGLTLRYTF